MSSQQGTKYGPQPLKPNLLNTLHHQRVLLAQNQILLFFFLSNIDTTDIEFMVVK